MIVPIEDHDVGGVEYAEETSTINDLLRQHELEIFASGFNLYQRRPHPKGCDAHWTRGSYQLQGQKRVRRIDRPWQKNAMIQST